MASAPRSFRPKVALVVAMLSLAGVYNVLADNAAVLGQAQAEACAGAGPGCAPALTRLLRTPFFQDLDFRASGQTVSVRCQRSLYLVGAYSCARRTPAVSP